MKEWIAMCPFFHFYGKIKVEVFMILKEEIYYSPCHKIRGLHIYLPDDYESSEDYYPVMYYFDGHNLFFDQDATYGKSWGLKDFRIVLGKSERNRKENVGMDCFRSQADD